MANMSSALADKLAREPQSSVSVIVRVEGDSAAYAQRVESRGVIIKHVYTLITGFALTGSAGAILALANEPWVVSIEEDKPVHTMS